jgi:hypothetical protein
MKADQQPSAGFFATHRNALSMHFFVESLRQKQEISARRCRYRCANRNAPRRLNDGMHIAEFRLFVSRHRFSDFNLRARALLSGAVLPSGGIHDNIRIW